MKKRCTNSACRRSFVAKDNRCPYCQKLYPRLDPAYLLRCRQEAAARISVEELDLPVRAYNTLKRSGIHTVADLLARKPEEVMRLRAICQNSLDWYSKQLAAFGIAYPRLKLKKTKRAAQKSRIGGKTRRGASAQN